MFLVDVQTTCMSLYNFSVSITAVQSLFLRSFFLFTIGLQYISHLKQKIVENNVKLLCVICMYVKCLSSDANHSKI